MTAVQAILVDRSRIIRVSVLITGLMLVAVAAYSSALGQLIERWVEQDEYSHGFFIPLISLGLLWARRDALVASIGQPSWWGPAIVLLAMLIYVSGELGRLAMFSHVSFVIALFGIVLGIGGFSLLRVAFVPIFFLLFAIPLPRFIDSFLSLKLQFISSELGVFFIRLFQIPVYLEGNVIDLGNYKLQVVEACSGLRYLYPLMSLAFLAAYLFQAPLWQRIVVFLSAIPITVVMNSLRIAIVGFLVDRWGTEQAEGWLHLFEGWVIFLACGGLLALEIYLFARFGSGKSFSQVFYLPTVKATLPQIREIEVSRAVPAAACFLLVCAAGLTVFFLAGRGEIIPDRARFTTFPTNLGPWQGRPSVLDPKTEQFLGLEDYALIDYKNPKNAGVNLYVAYYSSQHRGASIHSPSDCIPAGGWLIKKFDRTYYSDAAGKVSMPVNRVVIEKNSSKQIVYYWFDQRGRKIASEYWSRWYLFVDSIFKNRTDGALVRLTTPIYPNETESDADERVRSFIPDLEPRLGEYVPPVSTSSKRSVSKSVLGLES